MVVVVVVDGSVLPVFVDVKLALTDDIEVDALELLIPATVNNASRDLKQSRS